MGQKYIHTALYSGLPAMQPRFDRGYTGHEMLCGYCLNNPLRYADPSGWQSQPVITLPGGLSFYTLEDYHAYLRSLGHETPAFAGSYRYGPFQNGFGPGQFSGSGQDMVDYMNRKGYTTYDLNNGFSTHSISQSFDAACAYNDYHGSWGNTVAGSRRAAQYNFDNGLGAVNFTALQSIQATSVSSNAASGGAPLSPSSNGIPSSSTNNCGVNSYMLFQNRAEAEKYLSKNADCDKEKFFYINKDKTVLIGP